MEWREFMVLLRGLSPDSILAHTLRARQKRYGTDPDALTGQDAEAAIERLLG